MNRIFPSSFFGLKKQSDVFYGKKHLYYMIPGMSTGIHARNNNFVIFFFAGPEHNFIRSHIT